MGADGPCSPEQTDPLRYVGRVMSKLYASEINCSLSSDWDGGWKVTIGTGQTLAEGHAEDLWKAADWLHRQGKERFPDSNYAKRR